MLSLRSFSWAFLFCSAAIFLSLTACAGEKDVDNEALTAVSTPLPSGTTPAATHTSLPTITSEPAPERVEVVTPIILTAAPTVIPPVMPTNTATPAFPRYEGPPLERDSMGIQVHIHHEELPQIIDHLNRLGVGWVKVQVSWKLYQPEPERYDQEYFAELDRLISRAHANNIKVLLSVSKAPEWSRPVTEMDGPPTDFMLYKNFMSLLGSRYPGQVGAYELWNEPNLQREWNGAPLNAADFVRLVAAGASGIRESDPQAVIVSGAPAVTGINDGIAAIDDRIFMRAMLDSGIAGIVDAIGVHPYGWANPPDSSFGDPDSAVPSHNDHPSFFFLDTLNDYANLLQEYQVDKQLWGTEFGWGSFEGIKNKEGTPQPPPVNAPFMNNVSEQQQAEYILRAFSMAQESASVGPMFLWNLNFAPLLGTQFSESGYSLLRPDGSPRPSYLSLQDAAKK